MKNARVYWILLTLCAGITACGSEDDADDKIISQSSSGATATNNPTLVIEKADTALDVVSTGFTDFKFGDIIFQTTGGRLMVPLQEATGNNFTHCGMVAVGKNGNTFVIEAFDSVMRTPVDQWINRGVGGKYTVMRLKQHGTLMNESAQVKIRHQGRNFLGLPYDQKYLWGDDKLYCSELVYKLYQAAGVELCKLRPMNSYDLSTPAVKKAMALIYNGNIPYKENMVAPGDIYNSTMLEKVYSR